LFLIDQLFLLDHIKLLGESKESNILGGVITVEIFRLPRADLEQFRSGLASQYTILGPVARGIEVVFGPVNNADELKLDYDQTILPPKKFFHPPLETLFSFKGRQMVERESIETEKRVILGVHACDVSALKILDRVFGDTYPDPHYQEQRENTLIVALNCTKPCQNGFCTSFNTGPKVKDGFDLALTDLEDAYLVEVGSEVGRELAASLGLAAASEEDLTAAGQVLEKCREDMTRKIDQSNLGEFMLQQVDHPHWEELKERCLACGSCTHVCPTCFCFAVKDQVDLTLTDGYRERIWDSCQYYKFSQVALEHVFRPDRAARVKQRFYHKLAYYEQQFDTIGCVGCGRCVSACIVGIDPVEVVAALQEGPDSVPAQQFHGTGRKVCPSENPYTGQPAVLKAVIPQTGDTATYTFAFADEKQQQGYAFEPGTFNMLSILGVGEAPISISSSPDEKSYFEHTVRSVGSLTNLLKQLQVGDKAVIRGPYGSGWPVNEAKGKNVLIIAGGIGLAPLRPLIKKIENQRHEFGKVEILYGARNPQEMLFTDEFEHWRNLRDTKLLLTVDHAAGAEWKENVGVVTTLFNQITVEPENAIVVLCGPGIMMKFAVGDLLSRGFKPEQIFVSLERRMSCGIKKCGNCQIGPLFVCQDGPVFRYSEIKDLPEKAF
jgi:NAD(P)H-flavin reductase/NAD-dependent dihydropyrimidine dehydrogenase PreA subunit